MRPIPYRRDDVLWEIRGRLFFQMGLSLSAVFLFLRFAHAQKTIISARSPELQLRSHCLTVKKTTSMTIEGPDAS